MQCASAVQIFGANFRGGGLAKSFRSHYVPEAQSFGISRALRLAGTRDGAKYIDKPPQAAGTRTP